MKAKLRKRERTDQEIEEKIKHQRDDRNENLREIAEIRRLRRMDNEENNKREAAFRNLRNLSVLNKHMRKDEQIENTSSQIKQLAQEAYLSAVV